MSSFFLEVQERFGETKIVPLARSPFWIGRHPSNDLPLHDSFVSRHHASIVTDDDRIVVVDNESRNGVFVNGDRVVDRQQLKPGDIIAIDPYEIRLSAAALAADSSALRGEETIRYFTHKPSWDPIESLSCRLAVENQTAHRAATIPWHKLLSLLVGEQAEGFYESILEVVEELVSFDRCFLILFKNESVDTLEIVASRFTRGVDASRGTDLHLSRDILRRVLDRGEAVTVDVGQTASRLTESFIRSGAQNVLCIPLMTRGQVTGALYVDQFTETTPFSEKEVEGLAPLAGLVSLKIENLRLQQDQVESQINKRELEVAKAVQERFLPTNEFSLLGYSFDTFSQPSRQIGGDCIDILHDNGDKLTFAIGDVTGKGLSAALYMVGVMSAMRAHIVDGFSVQEVMTRLERYVRAKFRSDHFLTLLIGELDRVSGTLTYCNAGHMLPLVFSRDGRIYELEERDPALNLLPWESFILSTYQMAPGDLLLVYTDGAVDAENDQGEMFGKDRLISCVRTNLAEDPNIIRRAILSSLKLFVAGGFMSDDVALIILRRDD